MTNETELQAKLRMGAARQLGTVTNDARLRYLASDFAGIVFTSRDGHLRYVADKDPENFANDDTIRYAKVTCYSPSDGWKATIGYYNADDHAEWTGKLGTTTRTEMFDTAEEAREWLREQGVPIDDTRREVLEDYRHPEGCDMVSLDLHDGNTSFTCYVVDERGGRWILSRPQNPETEAYALTVNDTPTRLLPLANEAPEIDPWSPDHDPTVEYEVRKCWRHSADD